MRILQINSYYFTNKVHHFFRKELKSLELRNQYFIPLYKNANKTFSDPEVKGTLIYDRYDKIFFFTKIYKSLISLRKQIDIDRLTLVHAHTLISDGLTAYLLSLFKKKRYVVTVRNTDVNFFLPNFIFRFLGRKIIKRADAVFCLSPAYKERIGHIYPEINERKFVVLPNGIDPFWLRNKYSKSRSIDDKEIDLLFVGRLDRNKNLEILIDFLKTYDDRIYNLTVVGSNNIKYDFGEINYQLSNQNKIIYLGEIDSISTLKDIYRSSDIFVMLSLQESFGMCFIESLSQGLPIIYTENEGVDGFFNRIQVGASSKPTDLSMLKRNLDFIIKNYSQLSKNALKEVDRFNWNLITKKYIDTLKKIN